MRDFFFERTTQSVQLLCCSSFATSSKVVAMRNRTHDNACQKQRSHSTRAEPFCRHFPAHDCGQLTENVMQLKQLTTSVDWRHEIPPPRIWTRLAFCEHPFPKQVWLDLHSHDQPTTKAYAVLDIPSSTAATSSPSVPQPHPRETLTTSCNTLISQPTHASFQPCTCLDKCRGATNLSFLQHTYRQHKCS